MVSGVRGLVSSILRYAFRLLGALIVVVAIATGVWLTLLGEAPPGLPSPPDAPIADAASRTETAVTWVPRIGLRDYGVCTRILSLDGGGVRGLVPALILAEIEKRTGRPIYQQFDLIVGTSTGSILALGLTRPSDADARRPAYAAKDLVQLYRDHAARIFPSSYAPIRYLRRIFRPKFSPADVEAVYRDYFGNVRLIEALTNVAIPAYDIEDSRRLWFQSYSSPVGDLFMRDVVRGATAAPTYFAPARFAVRPSVSSKGNVAIVDGALFANNPSQDALQFGQKLRDAASVLLVSIGTGRSSRKHSFEEAWGWGVLGWMDPLLEIAFSDPAIDDVMRRQLEGRGDYFRLQVDLGGTPVDIDDSSPAALQRLEASTAAYLAKEEDAIRTVVNELSLPRASQCGPAIGADYERPEGPREHPTP
jgi:predicted acylesterase/phospholipase RssA